MGNVWIGYGFFQMIWWQFNFYNVYDLVDVDIDWSMKMFEMIFFSNDLVKMLFLRYKWFGIYSYWFGKNDNYDVWIDIHLDIL